MLTLFHHPMSTGSRYARLILNEYDIEVQLIEENSWARRKEFLSLNPAGTLPVLLAEGDVPVAGASVIAEYIDETRGALKRSRRLFPEDSLNRAEVRRLVDWFLSKFENEVTRHMARERIFKLHMTPEQGGGAPDSAAIRAARANITQHMKYIDWLTATRNWLAGPNPTYADMAAAASISILDYLGEVKWTEYRAARDWYTRMKSRPSFRPLLADRVRGLPPASHYGDLDF
ncbi:glutathione S-transferase family protein [Phyllobacterium sp. YR531]|uniref:glutathione S-transferase family protein n=1 Tax=Phyllobacterium sp. YR531 TaxID=1144343 RepID=UPI00026F5BCB|nr:glutathione S-transferase family protein [Phyllobacterium sp. YR531]EJN00024.1 glutathione S-transferase [Phyllobacterium sp. YR531]